LGRVITSASIERVGHERAVAWPHVAVGVAVELRGVAIVRRDDRSSVVDLGPDDEEAAAKDVAGPSGEVFGGRGTVADPAAPIRPAARQHLPGTAATHLSVEILHLEVAALGGDPHVEGRGP